MSVNIPLTKAGMDRYLKEIAKEFRKLGGKSMPAEIILIGGASILVNYGFRESTYDIDALIQAASCMKDAINYVTDKMGLPNGWINEDFKNTKSYTPKLVQYSRFYRTYANVLDVRTISGEYLIAMKLMAYRPYKHDISDIVGILLEHEQKNDVLTYEKIDKSVKDLYDGWENISEQAKKLLTQVLENEDLSSLYKIYCEEEAAAKETLIIFENEYPEALKEDNLEDILKQLKKKQENTSG